MAKELPFFKFFPGEWVTGDVTMVSMEAQGVFTNLCCYYWMRNCSISIANAKQRFSNNIAAFEELLKCDVVKVADDDQIVINFLDEQMNELVNVSEKRAKAGSAGGKAKAKQLLNFAVANHSYKEEEIEEEIDIDKEEEEESLSPAIAPTPSPKNYKKATMSEIIKTFDRVNKTSSDFEDFAGDYALTAIGFYELFDNNIKAAGGKATVLQKAKGTWIDDIRQICEKDGYNLNDLREAYTFLTHDLFWQKNILSAQTLRKQVDKLKMAIKSEKEKAERTAQKTGVKVGDPRFCTDWSKSNEEYHLGF